MVTVSRWLDHDDPAVRANAIICLIHQTNYLLDQQIDALERQFIDDGGYSEQLATARLQKRADARSKPNSSASSAQAADNVNQSPSPPACPICCRINVAADREKRTQSWKPVLGLLQVS